MRSAIGLIAGPESPPVTLASTGARRFTSMAMAGMVLISESASAPAPSTAAAIAGMLAACGESFTISVREKALRTADVRLGRGLRIRAELQPAAGHVRTGDVELQGVRSLGAVDPAAPRSAYSSTVEPSTLTTTVALAFFRKGSFSLRNTSTPTLASPIALSMPAAVSITRGIGLPGRGLSEIPLVTTAPSREMS